MTPEGSPRLIVKSLQLICCKKNEQLIWWKRKNEKETVGQIKIAHKFEDI